MIPASFGLEHMLDWSGAAEYLARLRCSSRTVSAGTSGKCSADRAVEFAPAIEPFSGRDSLWASFRKVWVPIFTFWNWNPLISYSSGLERFRCLHTSSASQTSSTRAAIRLFMGSTPERLRHPQQGYISQSPRSLQSDPEASRLRQLPYM